MANTNTAENAKLMYEAGQDFTDYEALSDDGDNKTFTSSANLWSGRSGYEAEVRPNGLITGGAVTVADSGTNNVVDVAALTCYLAGALESVSASTDFSISRPVGDFAKISSITVNASGALAEVEGSEATDTSFSATRGADGGPPWIPTDSIEIAQVRMTSSVAAVITESQIKQVVGTHCERYDHPIWEEDNYNGQIEFISAMPEIHSDDSGTTTATKEVYASFYEPTFTEQPYASEFEPPENTHSINSVQVYGTTLASASSSLGQGSFTTRLKDGVTDNIVAFVNETLWFKFYPDRNKSPYMLCQGKFGISRSFPAGDHIQADCTISATEAVHGVSS